MPSFSRTDNVLTDRLTGHARRFRGQLLVLGRGNFGVNVDPTANRKHFPQAEGEQPTRPLTDRVASFHLGQAWSRLLGCWRPCTSHFVVHPIRCILPAIGVGIGTFFKIDFRPGMPRKPCEWGAQYLMAPIRF